MRASHLNKALSLRGKILAISFENVVSMLVGSGIAIGVMKFLSTKLVNQLLTKELEKYKTELSERTEALKSKLAIFAHEQNIVASRVDSQKAHAIHEVYAAINNMCSPAAKIASGYPVMNSSIEAEIDYYFELSEYCHQASKDLSECLVANAIYFSPETYDQIAVLSSQTMSFNAHFLRPMRKGLAELTEYQVLINEVREAQKSYEANHRKHITWKVQEIVETFRRELGVI